MSVIAIIPARGGSKRVPRKNIKDFFGKPLIAYSIETAKNSNLFDKIIVSTDDEEIAKTAREYGAQVPFIRPKELSDDFTATGAVVEHALEFYKNQGITFEYCCTLYATAPLLTPAYLQEGLKTLQNSDAHMAFSVTSIPFPIQRTFKITPENRCEMFTPEFFTSRSQDLEVAYQDAGAFYFENLTNKAKDIAFGSDSIPIILPRYMVQDIDTLEDWEMAEIMYEVVQRKLKKGES
ncbi:pseudaminic acid cytidylyltransferase [Sulfurimonas sp.]|uniref:pseudaminic acid cytidylyltransferase n=1 Tax=Sulfurimonas sp. TaxID=2022749 RepID=UPI003D0ACA9F